MSRALSILGELQNVLDRQAGGELAARLDALYTYITSRLLEANVNREVGGVNEALRLITPLRAAWAEIASRSGSASRVSA
jgi:flagellar protein FliS